MPLQGPQKCYELVQTWSKCSLISDQSASCWQVLTDPRVRKTLAKINQHMRLPSNFDTFDAFMHSGASFVYDVDIPVKGTGHLGI